jgi:hypothetical protein
MKKNGLKVAAVLAVFLLVVGVGVYAASTSTIVRFNIDTLVSYTLTLPGVAPVNGGSATATTDIEFNVTTGTQTNVNAKVVGGGTTQSDGVPIFQLDNTGTVNLTLNVSLNTTLPSCITLAGSNTYAGADTGNSINSSTNYTIASSYAPGDAPIDWYMKADFSGCTVSDSTQKKVFTYGLQG